MKTKSKGIRKNNENENEINRNKKKSENENEIYRNKKK